MVEVACASLADFRSVFETFYRSSSRHVPLFERFDLVLFGWQEHGTS